MHHYKDPLKLYIPPKFKAPEFKRYDGSTCPEMHLRYYCQKMSPYANQEKLLMHVFQESLTEKVAKWYYQLEEGQIHTWRDLAREFLKQYQRLLGTTPDYFTLQNMRKSPNESYKEYAI